MYCKHTSYRYGEPASGGNSYYTCSDLQRTVRNIDSQRSAELYLDTFSEPERFDRLTGDGKSFFHHHLHGDGNR